MNIRHSFRNFSCDFASQSTHGVRNALVKLSVRFSYDRGEVLKRALPAVLCVRGLDEQQCTERGLPAADILADSELVLTRRAKFKKNSVCLGYYRLKAGSDLISQLAKFLDRLITVFDKQLIDELSKHLEIAGEEMLHFLEGIA